MLALIAAPLFVLIWSSGFVVARAAIIDADAQLVLLVRMGLVALVMATWGMAARDRWPHGWRALLHLAAGTLLPGAYLCGSWWALGKGMPAGIVSLLGGLQPLLVALLSRVMLGERIPLRGWTGLAIGTAGVALVLAPAIGRNGGGVPVAAAIVGIVAVLGMAGATILQGSRLAADALAPAVALQNIGGTIVALIAWIAVGHLRWHDTLMLWTSLIWSVLGLSAAALTLLAWMLRHQGAARVSALLLLVPPLAAIEAWVLFDETLVRIQIAGFAAALAGVLLVRGRPAGVEPG